MKVTNYDLILLLVILSYVIICPYTKVEESFNMQALFDFHHFHPISQLDAFDHLQFSGVVPRTFLGSLFLHIIGYPIYSILAKGYYFYHSYYFGEDTNGLITYEGIYTQMFYRMLLGFFSWLSIVHFKSSFRHIFSSNHRRIEELFSMGMILQFHINFYASRTLPNIFAFIIVMHAFAFWFSKHPLTCILLIAVAMTIFRCDMLVLLAPIVLAQLITKEIHFFQSLISGILVCCLGIGLSTLVDSYFWKQWLWPEGIVLRFNSVENRSSEWGVMPFHWYFSNALLKSLNLLWLWIVCGGLGVKYMRNSLSTSYWNPFARIKLFQYSKNIQRALYYLLPVMGFICLYSILPHKELRFVFVALPMFTMFAAVALNELLPSQSTDLWFPFSILTDDVEEEDYAERVKVAKKSDDMKQHPRHHPSVYPHLISLVWLAVIGGMFLLTNLFLMAANQNYPGGLAIDRLIEQHIGLEIALLDSNMNLIERPIFVHIDVLAATSGVTRFVQPRLLFQAKSNYKLPELDYLYLNSDPSRWEQFMNSLLADQTSGSNNQSSLPPMVNNNWINIGKDIVFYSKKEKDVDYQSFDWLITENITYFERLPQFRVVEKIPAFDRFQFSFSRKGLLQLKLKPVLYLVQNQHRNWVEQ